MHRFLLRIPKELYERVRAAARRANRSVNSEIIHRLKSYDEP